MGLLLCWNDHIRPVDEGTFSASSTNPYNNHHSCWEGNFVVKMLFYFTVVLLAAELKNNSVLDGRQAVIWCNKLNGSECQCPPLLFNLFFFKVMGGVLAVRVSH